MYVQQIPLQSIVHAAHGARVVNSTRHNRENIFAFSEIVLRTYRLRCKRRKHVSLHMIIGKRCQQGLLLREKTEGNASLGVLQPETRETMKFGRLRTRGYDGNRNVDEREMKLFLKKKKKKKKFVASCSTFCRIDRLRRENERRDCTLAESWTNEAVRSAVNLKPAGGPSTRLLCRFCGGYNEREYNTESRRDEPSGAEGNTVNEDGLVSATNTIEEKP